MHPDNFSLALPLLTGFTLANHGTTIRTCPEQYKTLPFFLLAELPLELVLPLQTQVQTQRQTQMQHTRLPGPCAHVAVGEKPLTPPCARRAGLHYTVTATLGCTRHAAKQPASHLCMCCPIHRLLSFGPRLLSPRETPKQQVPDPEASFLLELLERERRRGECNGFANSQSIEIFLSFN